MLNLKGDNHYIMGPVFLQSLNGERTSYIELKICFDNLPPRLYRVMLCLYPTLIILTIYELVETNPKKSYKLKVMENVQELQPNILHFVREFYINNFQFNVNVLNKIEITLFITKV